jgi:hypothetical protein
MVEPSDLERAKHFAEISGREARQKMASSLNLGSPFVCALQDRADAARARYTGMVVGFIARFRRKITGNSPTIRPRHQAA